MIPPTTTGTSPQPARRSSSSTSITSTPWLPERIERPITCTPSSRADAAISARRQPDALVDDLDADVARLDRDLLGAVRVPVEAGLADQQLQRASEPARQRAHALAHRRGVVARPPPTRRPTIAGRRAVLAEAAPQGVGPLAGRDAGLRGADRDGHHVAPRRQRVVELAQRARHLGGAAPAAERAQRLDLLALGRLVDDQDRRAPR